MAPISVAGALTLQHAEALAGIALAQLSRSGAPVIYGSFSSNVDMKSGSPAFGTPEHVRATLGAGQLARFLGLPWRSGGGSAANINDAQAAHETQFALWGSVLANFQPGPQDTWVDYKNDKRPPLLFVSGSEDHIMPPAVQRSNAKHYKSDTVTEIREYEGYAHLLPAQRGWQTIADEVLEWAVAHVQ